MVEGWREHANVPEDVRRVVCSTLPGDAASSFSFAGSHNEAQQAQPAGDHFLEYRGNAPTLTLKAAERSAWTWLESSHSVKCLSTVSVSPRWKLIRWPSPPRGWWWWWYGFRPLWLTPQAVTLGLPRSASPPNHLPPGRPAGRSMRPSLVPALRLPSFRHSGGRKLKPARCKWIVLPCAARCAVHCFQENNGVPKKGVLQAERADRLPGGSEEAQRLEG